MTDATKKDALIALRDKVQAGDHIFPRDAKPAFSEKVWLHACRAALGSLDAAKALHDTVLPAWQYVLRNGNDQDEVINGPDGSADGFFANVWSAGSDPNDGCKHYPSWADTTARAWLLAILSALIAEASE